MRSTVDMIATGTDVKPLECLLFMRNVNSAGYFEQMKGRGVRVIERDDLRSVKPDAKDKTHFVIVDAVGVCERDKTVFAAAGAQAFGQHGETASDGSGGMVHADLVSSLASRMARLGRQTDEAQASRIAQESDGEGSGRADRPTPREHRPADHARSGGLEVRAGRRREPSQEQLDSMEHERMSEALKPFTRPGLRAGDCEVAQNLYQIIDEAAIDVLLDFGHSEAAVESARSKLDDLPEIPRRQSRPHRGAPDPVQPPLPGRLRYRQVKELRERAAKSARVVARSRGRALAALRSTGAGSG